MPGSAQISFAVREQDALDRRVEPVGELAAEAVAHVDHGARSPGDAEQARLRRAVGLERAVVVEVVAREVGEHGGVEAHRRHAVLVQRVRGHLQPHRARAGVARRGQPPLHAHRVGRREARVRGASGAAEAERAEVPAAAADEFGGLRQQVRTVVLPFVPVMPATRRSADGRRKKRSASAPACRGKVRHGQCRTLSGSTGGSSPATGSHSTARAPRSTAASACIKPCVVRPWQARKTPPRVTSRLSSASL